MPLKRRLSAPSPSGAQIVRQHPARGNQITQGVSRRLLPPHASQCRPCATRTSPHSQSPSGPSRRKREGVTPEAQARCWRALARRPRCHMRWHSARGFSRPGSCHPSLGHASACAAVTSPRGQRWQGPTLEASLERDATGNDPLGSFHRATPHLDTSVRACWRPPWRAASPLAVTALTGREPQATSGSTCHGPSQERRGEWRMATNGYTTGAADRLGGAALNCRALAKDSWRCKRTPSKLLPERVPNAGGAVIDGIVLRMRVRARSCFVLLPRCRIKTSASTRVAAPKF